MINVKEAIYKNIGYLRHDSGPVIIMIGDALEILIDKLYEEIASSGDPIGTSILELEINEQFFE